MIELLDSIESTDDDIKYQCDDKIFMIQEKSNNSSSTGEEESLCPNHVFVLIVLPLMSLPKKKISYYKFLTKLRIL